MEVENCCKSTEITTMSSVIPTQYQPYETSAMTDALKQRAKLELFEDEDTSVSLKRLRAMLKEEKDLHWQDDDLFLLAFLRARKFNVKKAFNLMKNFYNVMRKHDELYHNFDFEKVRVTLEENIVGFLPYRDGEGSVILSIKAGTWNPLLNSMGDILRALTSGLLHAIMSPATQVAGFKVIVDFSGFSFRTLPHITPNYLWLISEALQNCFPGRFRAVHIVNENYLFGYVWVVLKQLLTKKLRERFHFHGNNVKKLHKYFDPRILPAEYDGELPPYDNKAWSEKLVESSSYINSIFLYGYKKH